MPAQLPEPGQIVIVRQRPFVVNDIESSTLPLPATVQDHGTPQHLLRLSSVEDEGLAVTRYDGSDTDVPDLELSDTPNAATYQFGLLSTLLAWNRLHPPTDLERERNQLIYEQLQRNRNPFIDNPAYAEGVFLGKSAFDAWRSIEFGEDNVAANPRAAATADQRVARRCVLCDVGR